MGIGRPLIAAFATVGALAIAGIVFLATRAMRRPVVTGVQAMVGDSAEVIGDFPGRGPGALRRRAVERAQRGAAARRASARAS